MNKDKKLWYSVVLTALITLPAGWALGNGTINVGLVKALGSVGENLFGKGNFGASIVAASPPDDGTPVVQIDVAGASPPDDTHPVYLNVFDPADASCKAMAQIAVTPEGVRFIIDPEVFPAGTDPVTFGPALGAPPNPCRDDNVIIPGPG